MNYTLSGLQCSREGKWVEFFQTRRVTQNEVPYVYEAAFGIDWVDNATFLRVERATRNLKAIPFVMRYW